MSDTTLKINDTTIHIHSSFGQKDLSDLLLDIAADQLLTEQSEKPSDASKYFRYNGVGDRNLY